MNKRNNQKEIITMPEQELRLVFAKETEPQDIISALSALCAAVKKKVCADYVKDYLKTQNKEFHSFLDMDAPKIRKNTARLLGEIGTEEDISYLQEALSKEHQLFVIPSILLAIGNIGGEQAKEILSSYQIPESGEDRNIQDIREALLKASNKLASFEFKTIVKLKKECDILVIPPDDFVDVLSSEMEEHQIRHSINRTGCIVHTDDIASLYTLRCAQEILIPLGKASNISEVVSLFQPYAEIPYRIELREVSENRNDFIKSIALGIGGRNNPSSYQNEFRIVRKDKGFYCYLNPYHVKDDRYTYRKQSIAASIHPATAASLIRYAKSLFPKKENVVVLDPCCGSGTILFEREYLGGCKSILGCDISNHAIDAAKTNKDAGNSKAQFIAKDLRKFNIREQADEIYANLPFGNRVGSHSENECLYDDLLRKLSDWMKEDGFAVLYTMEYHLLSRLLKQHKDLELVKQIQTEAGGLLPHVFVIRKRIV